MNKRTNRILILCYFGKFNDVSNNFLTILALNYMNKTKNKCQRRLNENDAHIKYEALHYYAFVYGLYLNFL